MLEFNTVHGFEPARSHTDKLNLGGAMDHARHPTERSAFVQSEYSCPVQNMKAAATELPHLQGEELQQQVCGVQELIATANW